MTSQNNGGQGNSTRMPHSMPHRMPHTMPHSMLAWPFETTAVQLTAVQPSSPSAVVAGELTSIHCTQRVLEALPFSWEVSTAMMATTPLVRHLSERLTMWTIDGNVHENGGGSTSSCSTERFKKSSRKSSAQQTEVPKRSFIKAYDPAYNRQNCIRGGGGHHADGTDASPSALEYSVPIRVSDSGDTARVLPLYDIVPVALPRRKQQGSNAVKEYGTSIDGVATTQHNVNEDTVGANKTCSNFINVDLEANDLLPLRHNTNDVSSTVELHMMPVDSIRRIAPATIADGSINDGRGNANYHHNQVREEALVFCEQASLPLWAMQSLSLLSSPTKHAEGYRRIRSGGHGIASPPQQHQKGTANFWETTKSTSQFGGGAASENNAVFRNVFTSLDDVRRAVDLAAEGSSKRFALVLDGGEEGKNETFKDVFVRKQYKTWTTTSSRRLVSSSTPSIGGGGSTSRGSHQDPSPTTGSPSAFTVRSASSPSGTAPSFKNPGTAAAATTLGMSTAANPLREVLRGEVHTSPMDGVHNTTSKSLLNLLKKVALLPVLSSPMLQILEEDEKKGSTNTTSSTIRELRCRSLTPTLTHITLANLPYLDSVMPFAKHSGGATTSTPQQTDQLPALEHLLVLELVNLPRLRPDGLYGLGRLPQLKMLSIKYCGHRIELHEDEPIGRATVLNPFSGEVSKKNLTRRVSTSSGQDLLGDNDQLAAFDAFNSADHIPSDTDHPLRKYYWEVGGTLTPTLQIGTGLQGSTSLEHLSIDTVSDVKLAGIESIDSLRTLWVKDAASITWGAEVHSAKPSSAFSDQDVQKKEELDDLAALLAMSSQPLQVERMAAPEEYLYGVLSNEERKEKKKKAAEDPRTRLEEDDNVHGAANRYKLLPPNLTALSLALCERLPGPCLTFGACLSNGGNNLTELDLRSTCVTTLDPLVFLPNLQLLDCNGCYELTHVASSSTVALVNMSQKNTVAATHDEDEENSFVPFPRLKFLALGCTSVCDTSEQTTLLANIPQLEILHLNACLRGGTATSSGTVKNLAYSKSLRSLHLLENTLDDVCIQGLALIPTLEKLFLSESTIEDVSDSLVGQHWIRVGAGVPEYKMADKVAEFHARQDRGRSVAASVGRIANPSAAMKTGIPLSNIRVLHLSYCKYVTASGLASLHAATPLLDKLKLNGCKSLNSLKLWMNKQKVFSHLRELHMDRCAEIKEEEWRTAGENSFQFAPQLEILSLMANWEFNSVALLNLATTKDIYKQQVQSPDEARGCYPDVKVHCPCLRKLSVSVKDAVSLSGVELLLPTLEFLHVVTDVSELRPPRQYTIVSDTSAMGEVGANGSQPSSSPLKYFHLTSRKIFSTLGPTSSFASVLPPDSDTNTTTNVPAELTATDRFLRYFLVYCCERFGNNHRANNTTTATSHANSSAKASQLELISIHGYEVSDVTFLSHLLPTRTTEDAILEREDELRYLRDDVLHHQRRKEDEDAGRFAAAVVALEVMERNKRRNPSRMRFQNLASLSIQMSPVLQPRGLHGLQWCPQLHTISVEQCPTFNGDVSFLGSQNTEHYADGGANYAFALRLFCVNKTPLGQFVKKHRQTRHEVAEQVVRTMDTSMTPGVPSSMSSLAGGRSTAITSTSTAGAPLTAAGIPAPFHGEEVFRIRDGSSASKNHHGAKDIVPSVFAPLFGSHGLGENVVIAH